MEVRASCSTSLFRILVIERARPVRSVLRAEAGREITGSWALARGVAGALLLGAESGVVLFGGWC